jgi:hypothetical protein
VGCRAMQQLDWVLDAAARQGLRPGSPKIRYAAPEHFDRRIFKKCQGRGRGNPRISARKRDSPVFVPISRLEYSSANQAKICSTASMPSPNRESWMTSPDA